MMEKINDGGPAFPTPDGVVICSGISIRDYFAAKAMEAMVATEYGSQVTCKKWAEEAYEMADAMIKAREVQS